METDSLQDDFQKYDPLDENTENGITLHDLDGQGGDNSVRGLSPSPWNCRNWSPLEGVRELKTMPQDIIKGIWLLLQDPREYFELEERQTTVGKELRAAFTTFLTMLYIIFTNPAILSRNGLGGGVPVASATAMTALASGLCCILMGVIANFPMAVASGMGLNAFVAYTVINPDKGDTWQEAMGLMILDGAVILFLVLLGIRESLLRAIPSDLRRGIGLGIGMYISLIGMTNAKMVKIPKSSVEGLTAQPDSILPPVSFGPLSQPETCIACLGLIVTTILIVKRVRGALVIGILVTTAIAAAFPGVIEWPSEFPTPDFSIVGKANISSMFENRSKTSRFLTHLFAAIMADFFDTLGTMTVISEKAGLTKPDGSIPSARGVLVVDALSACIGGLFGVSSITGYIESASGIQEGARTGIHTIAVGVLFLIATFLAPLGKIVPLCATSPVLILVGFLMCDQIRHVNWKSHESAIPVFLIMTTTPFTYSISHGIGYGFISYTLIHVLTCRIKEVHPMMCIFTGIFFFYFIYE